MTWYYAQGDQRQGPVSDSELDALIAAGTVTENTLVWKEGMADWAALKVARPASPGSEVPAGWIKCTATGRYFPPEEIVYLDGKPYSAAAKASVLQGVLQTGTLPNPDENRTGPPWENRETLGFFTALWETIRGVFADPAATFSNMRREGGLGAPMVYYIILGCVSGLAQLLYQYLSHDGFSALSKNPNPILQMMGTTNFIIARCALMPVFIILASFIGSGVFHLSLMICQGATKPFETTYRTYCYVSGSAGLLFLLPTPLMGQAILLSWAFIGSIWSLVLLCIGLSRTQEISGGRAVLAVLLPVVLCCFTVFFLAVVLGFATAFAAQAGHH